jgi:hypothetical protein
MALLWPVDEDSLLFQACMAVGLFVVVAEAALPAVLGRLRLRQPLRAPLLPAREFQRRKRELQHEARALQLDVAAAAHSIASADARAQLVTERRVFRLWKRWRLEGWRAGVSNPQRKQSEKQTQ